MTGLDATVLGVVRDWWRRRAEHRSRRRLPPLDAGWTEGRPAQHQGQVVPGRLLRAPVSGREVVGYRVELGARAKITR